MPYVPPHANLLRENINSKENGAKLLQASREIGLEVKRGENKYMSMTKSRRQ